MKMHRFLLQTFLAALIFSLLILGACGDDDSDDDDDAAAQEVTCDIALGFLFETCFTLADGEGNQLTAGNLCDDPDFEEEVECYMQCYEDFEYCPDMGLCLAESCDLDIQFD